MSYAAISTLFLLFFLDLTNFAQSWYFWGYYVDYPRTTFEGNPDNYCNMIAKQRWLMMGRSCVPFHTFIHDTKETIFNICAGPESQDCTYTATCHKSPNPILVTDCYTRTLNNFPNCQYKQKVHLRTVELYCENGQPQRLYGPIYPPASYT